MDNNKRYLKIFNNLEEYNEKKDDIMDYPHVVVLESTKEIIFQYSFNYSKGYFTIEALENGLTVKLSQNASEYRIDDGEWISLSKDTATPSINKGQKISFKITNPTISSSYGIGTFTVNKAFNVEGNIMSLLYGASFEGQNNLSGKNYAFHNLFRNCTTLKSAENLILSATTLANYCYQSMFFDCTSLTTAPDLPATTLAFFCYDSMFNGCTALTTTAPDLPAIELAIGCYSNMFKDCTSLTTAPDLPATTLTNFCYSYMFFNCSKLNKITMLATDISAADCLIRWVDRVASSGTFFKNPQMTSLPSGAYGIPSGWTVKDYYDHDPTNGYEYVDLGLPSGIKWAKLNVGATKESDPGLFFQWGDTQGYTSDQCGNGEGQKEFDWTDYKWCNGSSYTLTKYCTNSYYGIVDNKAQLDLEDDGCHVYMGGDWRLPTGTNIQELIDNTICEYATIDGMEGKKFTNKVDSSKYIFLPDACCARSSLWLGTSFLSWSSSIGDYYSYDAQCLRCGGNSCIVSQYDRSFGFPLRGVIDEVNNDTNTTIEVDETSINLLSNVEVTEDSITLLGNNIKIDSDENNNYNIIIE